MKNIACIRCFLVCCITLLAGCVSLPDHLRPVAGFELPRYLGHWYEIARLDHSFERGLQRVTADYSLRPDGGVKVINRGYAADDQRWREAEGRAYFVETPDQGFLKVSFFGPFYGSYVILELDQTAYQYALVAGPNRSFLWILARTPKLNPDILDSLIGKARAMGFATDQLIFPEQAG
ncbi:lipocalin [Candidatus Woesearchaeota archaeon]|nr:lipocalin [Candidatus Woesearchaeota archaeon]